MHSDTQTQTQNGGDECIPGTSIPIAGIRRTRYMDEWYYCVVDVVARLRETNHKAALNYYHVLKNRMTKNGDSSIFNANVKQLKMQTADGKMRRTDCASASSVQSLEQYIRIGIRQYEIRASIRKDDEVINFHPQVIRFFEQRGWDTHHHVKLSSKRVVDIVARRGDETLIIECKPQLDTRYLYKAIGQVLCYQAEYGRNSTPVIATYLSWNNGYAQRCCEALGIQLIEIEKEHE